MWQQLIESAKRSVIPVLEASAQTAGGWLRRVGVWLVAFARGPLRTTLRTALHVIAALLLLFYEWGWQPLAAALARLSKFVAVAKLEAWIKRLPPYPALALIAVPALCLIPLKLFALYLFATGHPVMGVGLIVAAKIAGTAFVARIFMLTQPQLMQIAWFKSAHDRFVPWKEAMFAKIRASEVWRNGRIARVVAKRGANHLWINLAPQRAWMTGRIATLRGDIRTFLAGLGKELR